jgi:hypothetical protein
MNVNDIYTPLSEAKAELERRWNDPELKRKVEEFLGSDLPIFFRSEPRAILSRGILTPNFETKYFLDLMDLVGLNPICAEFYDDKFSSQNKDKVHLGKLVFYHKTNKKGENLITKKTIIDFNAHENKSFKDIKTFHDKDFIDFHHFLYNKEHKKNMDFFDASIFKINNATIVDFYEKLLSLCIMNGILFENFIAKENEHEKRFTENVVLPAFKSVFERFNLKPLVIPLLPLKNEEKETWTWYAGYLEEEVDNFFNNN